MLDHDANFFEDDLTKTTNVTSHDTTLSLSEWSRPAKLSQAACRLLKVGAVLGRPRARVPKVSPEMVGSLLRGNDFGGNPQERGKQYSHVRELLSSRVGEESRRGGGGTTFPARRALYLTLESAATRRKGVNNTPMLGN